MPILLLLLLLCPAATAGEAEEPRTDTYRRWIEQMKQAPRGPFRRIRWFCKDGSILPPEPYACVPHGGGTQHGEWSQRTLELREQGYYIATLLADLPEEYFSEIPERHQRLAQLLIEKFLINIDGGWILRRARSYRGAIQAEAEARGGRALLLRLLGDPAWLRRGFLPLRIATALLPHGVETGSMLQVRQLSADLAERDPTFVPLRNKIHNHPEVEDALMVRDHAGQVEDPELKKELERLAGLIEQVYRPRDLRQSLSELAGRRSVPPELAQRLEAATASFGGQANAATRLYESAALLAAIRDSLPRFGGPVYQLKALDLSLALEREHGVAASELAGVLDQMNRRQRLELLQQSLRAAWGTGLLSRREYQALTGEMTPLEQPELSVAAYKGVLDYLARVPGWAGRRLQFHFGSAMEKLGEIEPKARLFAQDQLRGSPLLFYSRLLEGLLRDANRLAGLHHRLFDEARGAGLRALNPGLARGVLHAAGGGVGEHPDPEGIYLLPETVSDLPPVAGILTAGEGNPLSHVQLLARNLGIPNVAVDRSLLPLLASHDGERVILAVSPAGSVQLIRDDGRLDQDREQEERVLIRPDLQKLDLEQTALLRLSTLRASDSGRVVGPKAAKLGELYHHFPEAVADGLAIPFGVFRRLLDSPHPEGGTVFDWMQRNYRALERLPAGSPERERQTEAFRAALHDWVLHADPGEQFRRELRRAMAEVFGPDGSYGVFVRSDTNVEDLPGFTGAGLNLTVPNVVGVEQVLAAIPRVWASPFTARAFAWRQSRMEAPEHVYPAVLLLRSVANDKSGVMVTQEIETGDRGWISVAVNEGIGGAVDGQAAESLRIELATGRVRLMAQASAPFRRVLKPEGGLDRVPVSGRSRVLEPPEIAQLITLARELPQRFPPITDAEGRPAPADVEFGFEQGELRLFQIRPFLESRHARNSEYLRALDAGLEQHAGLPVDLDATPEPAP